MKKDVPISPETEKRMRILANLIIDRLFDDVKNQKIKNLENTKKTKVQSPKI